MMNNAFPYTNPYSQVSQPQPQQRSTAANPYHRSNTSSHQQQSSPLPSLEDALCQLERSAVGGENSSVAIILQQLCNASSSPDNDRPSCSWTISQVLRFIEWVLLSTKQPQRNSSSAVSAIFWTTAALLKHWDEALVYAAVTVGDYDDNDDNSSRRRQRTLLTVLQSVIIMSNKEEQDGASSCSLILLKASALTALAAAWMSLERWNNGTPAWWIISDDDDFTSTTETLVRFALQGLLVCQNDDDNNEQWWQGNNHSLVLFKTACAYTLTHIIMQTGQDFDAAFLLLDGNHSNSAVPSSGLSHQLLQESRRLNDANMPPSTYCDFSLACLQLLVCLQQQQAGGFLEQDASLQQDIKRFLQSTGIVQHIVAATFGTKHHHHDSTNSPRWTQQQQQSNNTCLDVLKTMYRVSRNATATVLAQHPCTQHFAEYAWKEILLQQQQQQTALPPNEHLLVRLLFLHKTCRQLTREAFKLVVLEEQQGGDDAACYQRLLSTLLDWTRQHHSVVAAELLKDLLADRLDAVRHDELSRNLWQQLGCNDRFCSTTFQIVMELCTTTSASSSSLSDYHRPTLLFLLDICYILMKADDAICQSVLASLSADTVESLVQAVSPKEVRVDMSVTIAADQRDDDVIESEESTPPANNLSRLDTSMSVTEIQRVSRGLDPAIRMAAATLLAVIGNSSSTQQANNQQIALLRGRAIDGANSLVADLQLSLDGASSKSAGPASLDMTQRRLRLLTCLATADNEEYLAGLIHAADAAQQKSTSELHRRLDRCNQALKECHEKEQRFIAEKDRYLARLSTQSVAFQREKSELQREFARNSKQLVNVHAAERQKAENRARELAKQMSETQQAVMTCRESEAKARSSLEAATAQLNEVAAREQDLIQRSELGEKELHRVKSELNATKASLNDVSAKEKELRQRIVEQDEHMAEMEESEGQMRDSLESLFGDMVSLARLYEIKEKEQYASRKKEDQLVEKLQRQLEAERQRNANLQEREKIIQCENDMLSKKYAKAKEKLEKERNDRQREADQRRKRAGPVSYINQLHNSTAAATSASGASEKSSSRKNGKENGSSTSSRSSKRR